MASEPVDYCRDIEAYLCRKNGGHLVRVVGPSFEVVSGWADRGIPLKIALQGIDRYFERYDRKHRQTDGRRRRPVQIEFCDADVLDAFDEWRRALGLSASRGPAAPLDAGSQPASPQPGVQTRPSSASLPAHLERVVLRLTAARAGGRIDEAFDTVIDAVARELDRARASAGGLRGDARQALIGRLAALDLELLATAKATLDDVAVAELQREADEELAGFRTAMVSDVFARARAAAVDRLVRERFGLPLVAFT